MQIGTWKQSCSLVQLCSLSCLLLEPQQTNQNLENNDLNIKKSERKNNIVYTTGPNSETEERDLMCHGPGAF